MKFQKKNYNALTEEQQMIVYNLIISLGKLNEKNNVIPKKREFGQYASKAVFLDDWEMPEE